MPAVQLFEYLPCVSCTHTHTHDLWQINWNLRLIWIFLRFSITCRLSDAGHNWNWNSIKPQPSINRRRHHSCQRFLNWKCPIVLGRYYQPTLKAAPRVVHPNSRAFRRCIEFQSTDQVCCVDWRIFQMRERWHIWNFQFSWIFGFVVRRCLWLMSAQQIDEKKKRCRNSHNLSTNVRSIMCVCVCTFAHPIDVTKLVRTSTDDASSCHHHRRHVFHFNIKRNDLHRNV